MNHDLDVVGRLVDYHDHIAPPPVPLTADLARGRRRVRRNRGLAGGAAALGVVAVGVAVSLAIGSGSPDRSLPAGPSSTTRTTAAPTPDGLGLTTPLLAPTSLLDVEELAFHVDPVPGFDPEGLGAGWSADEDGQTVTLRWDEVADELDVKVLYHGEQPPLDPSVWGHRENVTIHGAAGHYVQRPGGPYSIDGDFEAAVAWEYSPGSWVHVSTRSDRGDPGPERLRSALIAVADAVRPGGDPVRLPVRTGAFPASMPDPSAPSSMGVHLRRTGWETTLEFGPMRFRIGPGTASDSCSRYDGGTEPFTYRGHPGCLKGEGSTDQPPAGTRFNFVNAIALQVGDTVRTVEPTGQTGEGPEYPIADLKQALVGLTPAPQDDRSAWFDVTTALGG